MNGHINEGLDCDDCEINADPQFRNNNHTNIKIIRSKYNQETLFRKIEYRKSTSFFKRKFCNLNKKTIQICVKKTFPMFTWLCSYHKDDFMGDLVSGCTVAIMQIPQGMGYSLLANLPPVIGIYMSLFPVLIYMLLGTSKHNSMGTFAVISIMVGKCVSTYSHEYSETSIAKSVAYSPVEIATLICFMVGIIQLLMYILRMGALSFLFSESLISGFTTGAAIHVLTSQIKDLLGIKLPGINGNFQLIKTYIEIFNRLSESNMAAVILSSTTISLLLINDKILKPFMARRSKIPIPIELIVIVSGTLLSKFIQIDESLNVIGHIPLGFPGVTIPRFSLWRELLLDCVAIALVSYSVTVSMALIFGQKLKYDIDFNQELLAMGCANIFGSFFSCFPVSASLSRSLLQENVGGKTQLASLISCVLLFIVLMWIGAFFETLPRCILASIIVWAIKGAIKFTDFCRFKRNSKIDGFICIFTCFSVVTLSIDIGLLIGVCLSILCIFCNGLKLSVYELRNVFNTELFLSKENFQRTVEVKNTKILQISGSFIFATKFYFRNQIYSALNINLTEELKIKEMMNANKFASDNASRINFKHLVLDFAPLTTIDACSISMLTDLIKDFDKLNIKISITCCSTKIYETFVKNEFLFMNILYPSIQDAV